MAAFNVANCSEHIAFCKDTEHSVRLVSTAEQCTKYSTRIMFQYERVANLRTCPPQRTRCEVMLRCVRRLAGGFAGVLFFQGPGRRRVLESLSPSFLGEKALLSHEGKDPV